MKKLSLEEFQQYVVTEAKRLYKLEILKEEKSKIEEELENLKETSFPVDGIDLSDPEILKQVRQAMLKKATGWATPEPSQVLSELDKKAMQAAKKDIEASGEKFTPLGKSKFEKGLDKKALNKAMSPEKSLEEKKYSDEASDFIGKEISHLVKDKGYEHDRAVAAALDIAREKGYKVPEKKNEGDEPVADVWQMYFFKVKHDNGVMKIKTASTSEDAARKAIANAEGAPESAITFIKSKPLSK